MVSRQSDVSPCFFPAHPLRPLTHGEGRLLGRRRHCVGLRGRLWARICNIAGKPGSTCHPGLVENLGLGYMLVVVVVLLESGALEMFFFLLFGSRELWICFLPGVWKR